MSERGQEVTRLLYDEVRRYDPRGHAMVTIGSNFMPWENARKCADILKFAGYNYGEKYYEEHHKKHPEVRRPQRCKAVGFIISPTDSPC